MRLVIDGQRLSVHRTGVGRLLEGLLDEWSTTGWPLDEVVLVVRDPAGLVRVPESPGLTPLLVGSRWPGLAWETFGLRGQLRRDDLLFAPANLVPWNWHEATVLIVHDTLLWSMPESFPWYARFRFGWRYRLAVRRATRIIVPSQSTARDVARVHAVPEASLRVIYPGPEPRFRPLSPASSEVATARRAVGLGEGSFFLFVGKRSRRRHVPAILLAFAQHQARWPDHRLVFVGPSGGAVIPRSDLGAIDAGHVSERVLHGLFAGALGLLYPSEYEGFGLPVVEAMACGCPVVTLRNSALTESAGDAAFYLETPDPASLGRAMDALAADATLRTHLAKQGIEHAAKFRRAAFAEGVKEEIRRVAGDWARRV
jgi:glycosyltransferase involved in cell wall biosynthesis